MEDFDTTPVDENESECPCCAVLARRVAALEVLVADLQYSRRVRRAQVEDNDEQWW
jgi:hypothetical protein